DAKTALDWGLIDYVVAEGATYEKAVEIAQAASKLPPTALKMVKHDSNAAAFALANATVYRDLEAFALLQESEDFKEGVTSFLQGREPDFTGD
ncbi:MAG: enoyl-CoA hydratase-related protein, partial [Pseudomonadota bacterium]